ncbi:hypothetical protein EDC01DRAFT_778353 [Geopyxis carbonaria]|nr:hypothetical protein EDC01DRAFT_778353 [Geopyxis carbonaria]
MSIETVTVIGGTGVLGRHIVTALLAAPTPYSVQVTTRSPPASISPPLPSSPRLKITQLATYTLPALTAALQGQHCVISAIGVSGMLTQLTIIDACVAAGVRRFVSGEFGYGRENDGIEELRKPRDVKRRVTEYAAAKGAVGGVTWSAVAPGVFIDFALQRFPYALGMYPDEQRAVLIDHGAAPFTGTTLRGIAQACVGICAHPAETADRMVRVRSVRCTQLELLRAYESVVSGGKEWDVAHMTAGELIARGREKREKGEGGAMLDLVAGQLLMVGRGGSVVCGEGAEGGVEGDNELLGVVEEPLEEIVKRVLAGDVYA